MVFKMKYGKWFDNVLIIEKNSVNWICFSKYQVNDIEFVVYSCGEIYENLLKKNCISNVS